MELVRRHDIRMAVLKARSPSCGNLENYDGRFNGSRVAGEGVTAAALKRMGVLVFNEDGPRRGLPGRPRRRRLNAQRRSGAVRRFSRAFCTRSKSAESSQ